MPRAELPTTAQGWLTALAAAFVGFIAGFLFIRMINGMAG